MSLGGECMTNKSWNCRCWWDKTKKLKHTKLLKFVLLCLRVSFKQKKKKLLLYRTNKCYLKLLIKIYSTNVTWNFLLKYIQGTEIIYETHISSNYETRNQTKINHETLNYIVNFNTLKAISFMWIRGNKIRCRDKAIVNKCIL